MTKASETLSTMQTPAMNRALAVTAEQIKHARRLCDEANVPQGPTEILTMLQVLATNYLAERK